MKQDLDNLLQRIQDTKTEIDISEDMDEIFTFTQYQKEMLEEQIHHMNQYAYVLTERIKDGNKNVARNN